MRRRQSGHTLVEVMFALFLMVGCGFIYTASMPMANVSRGKAALSNIALGLAQKELEAIRARGYSGSTAEMLAQDRPDDGRPMLIDSATEVATNTYSFSNNDVAAHDSPAGVLPGGSGAVVLEQADLDLRRVTVQVNWTELGRPRSVRLGTMIANL